MEEVAYEAAKAASDSPCVSQKASWRVLLAHLAHMPLGIEVPGQICQDFQEQKADSLSQIPQQYTARLTKLAEPSRSSLAEGVLAKQPLSNRVKK